MNTQAAHSASHACPPYNSLVGALLTVCVLTLSLAPDLARAQTDVVPPTPNTTVEGSGNALDITSTIWRAHFGAQAAWVLRNESPSAADELIHGLIVVATTDQNEIDLSHAVFPLLQVVETSSNEARRLMALQALNTIGTEHASSRLYHRAMERLYDTAQEERSERVRRAAADVLNTYAQNGETQ